MCHQEMFAAYKSCPRRLLHCTEVRFLVRVIVVPVPLLVSVLTHCKFQSQPRKSFASVSDYLCFDIGYTNGFHSEISGNSHVSLEDRDCCICQTVILFNSLFSLPVFISTSQNLMVLTYRYRESMFSFLAGITVFARCAWFSCGTLAIHPYVPSLWNASHPPLCPICRNETREFVAVYDA